MVSIRSFPDTPNDPIPGIPGIWRPSGSQDPDPMGSRSGVWRPQSRSSGPWILIPHSVILSMDYAHAAPVEGFGQTPYLPIWADIRGPGIWTPMGSGPLDPDPMGSGIPWIQRSEILRTPKRTPFRTPFDPFWDPF